MCKQDTGSVKVAPESMLSNRGNLRGIHLTWFSPGVYRRGGFISRGVISVHHRMRTSQMNNDKNNNSVKRFCQRMPMGEDGE